MKAAGISRFQRLAASQALRSVSFFAVKAGEGSFPMFPNIILLQSQLLFQILKFMQSLNTMSFLNQEFSVEGTAVLIVVL